jgi:hypothetical protein
MSTTLKVLLANLLLPTDGLPSSDPQSGRTRVVNSVNSGLVNQLNTDAPRLLLSVNVDMGTVSGLLGSATRAVRPQAWPCLAAVTGV